MTNYHLQIHKNLAVQQEEGIITGRNWTDIGVVPGGVVTSKTLKNPFGDFQVDSSKSKVK